MDSILDTIKGWAPAIALFIIVGALVYGVSLALKAITHLEGPTETALPILAIGGVVVLVLMLTIVAAVFWWLGLSNSTQALGLPEGSIRAVIALSLIVLFAILAVYLYANVSTGGQLNTIQNLSVIERDQFLKDHSTARDLASHLENKAEGDPAKALYTVTYRSTNPAGDDFAKQLLILLGTLMTAITSFYLGAGTATTAATQTAAAQSAAIVKPSIASVDPSTYSIGTGTTVRLKVMGKNLNIITHVKLIRSGVQIIATDVTSNPTQVICNIGVSTGAIGAAWDVVADDGASQSATLPAALTITA